MLVLFDFSTNIRIPFKPAKHDADFNNTFLRSITITDYSYPKTEKCVFPKQFILYIYIYIYNIKFRTHFLPLNFSLL